MGSWIYIFSKFTPEALLFEALIICLICTGYAAFWVLNKRKYGVLGQATPAYAVKSYLSQLIFDAEQMRIQLFGLLAGTGVDPQVMAQLRAAGAGPSVATHASPISAAALAADPELAAKITAIEAKMLEQAKAMETITVEKVKVEKELVEALAGKGGTSAPVAEADPKLAEKIKSLEAKLAEYSVIEDDLANLKRLQQENVQLKAQLGGRPAASAASGGKVAAAAEPVFEEPAISETPLESPSAASAGAEEAGGAAETAPPAEEVQAAADAVAATDAAISEAAAEPIAASTGNAGFEGLVDQVEQSLAQPQEAAPAVAEPAAGATALDPANSASSGAVSESAAAPSTHNNEKTDADLVAEFEKMLNS